MSEGEKEGPARQKEDCLPPSCGTRPARPGKGKCGALALTSRINYMDNSLGEVKKATSTREDFQPTQPSIPQPCKTLGWVGRVSRFGTLTLSCNVHRRESQGLRAQPLIPQTEGMSHKPETDQDIDDALYASFNGLATGQMDKREVKARL